MCVAGKIWAYTEDGEQDVDQEVGAAATLEEDTDGREEDGEDDLDDVAVNLVSYDSSPSLPRASDRC